MAGPVADVYIGSDRSWYRCRVRQGPRRSAARPGVTLPFTASERARRPTARRLPRHTDASAPRQARPPPRGRPPCCDADRASDGTKERPHVQQRLRRHRRGLGQQRRCGRIHRRSVEHPRPRPLATSSLGDERRTQRSMAAAPCRATQAGTRADRDWVDPAVRTAPRAARRHRRGRPGGRAQPTVGSLAGVGVAPTPQCWVRDRSPARRPRSPTPGVYDEARVAPGQRRLPGRAVRDADLAPCDDGWEVARTARHGRWRPTGLRRGPGGRWRRAVVEPPAIAAGTGQAPGAPARASRPQHPLQVLGGGRAQLHPLALLGLGAPPSRRGSIPASSTRRSSIRQRPSTLSHRSWYSPQRTMSALV